MPTAPPIRRVPVSPDIQHFRDHKAEFILLVQKHLGKKASDSIEWTSPRVLCIAGDRTRYGDNLVLFGVTKTVSNIGHYGTGDLEIRLHSALDFEKAKPLLLQSYELS